jgi:uncharacterized protein YggE
MKRFVPLVVGGGLAAAVLALGAVVVTQDGPRPATAQSPSTTTAPADGHGPARTVTVEGEGTVTGTPDTVHLSLGVHAEAPKAVEALSVANAKADRLLQTLLQAGVAKTDVTTTDVSLYPRYDDGGHATGYTASNTVSVTLHGVDKAGPTIDAATSAVGDGVTFGGVWFAIDDTSALAAQARAGAVADARTHAEQLARAAGARVGEVLAMDESTSSPVVPYPRATGAADSTKTSTNIEPGSQKVQLDVRITFALVS